MPATFNAKHNENYSSISSDLLHYAKTMKALKTDLDQIFRKIRSILYFSSIFFSNCNHNRVVKEKLSALHPEAVAAAAEQHAPPALPDFTDEELDRMQEK